MTRAARPRTSSAGPGCACWAASRSRSRTASDSRTNPKPGLDHQTSSSASRDRWTIASAHRGQRLDDEVPVPRRVDGVAGHALEPELGGEPLAIDADAAARDRARAQRRDVRAAAGRPRAGRGRAPASPRRRAGGGRTAPAARAGCGCGPASRVAGVAARARPAPVRASSSRAVDLVDRPAEPEPQVGRHLVVPRPPGVELAARPARSAAPSSNSTFMWTSSSVGSQAIAPARCPSRIAVSPATIVSTSGAGQQAGLGEGAGIGDRARDVVDRELDVDVESTGRTRARAASGSPARRAPQVFTGASLPRPPGFASGR